MRCVGALLDNAQKLHAARGRDISIVHHNERPSDVIQYFFIFHDIAPQSIYATFFAVSLVTEWISFPTRCVPIASRSRIGNQDCFRRCIFRYPF